MKSVAKRFLALLCLVLSLGVPVSPLHAENFPSKTIRIIVPFPTGNAADVSVRIIGNELQELFGKAVVVENKPGAFGALAVREVLKSAGADTLCFCADGQITIFPSERRLYRRDEPYKPEDLIPIGTAIKERFTLLVNTQVPASNPRGLLAYACANPGKLSLAVPNPTGTVVAKTLNAASCPNAVVDVSYQTPTTGENAAVGALIGGHVQLLAASTLSVLGQIGSDKVRVMGGLGVERNPFFKEVRTLDEQGVHGVGKIPASWAGFFAPQGTPDAAIDIFASALSRALTKPSVIAELQTAGIAPFVSTRRELEALIARDSGVYRSLFQELGIKLLGE